jgi:hypothetical protein
MGVADEGKSGSGWLRDVDLRTIHACLEERIAQAQRLLTFP